MKKSLLLSFVFSIFLIGIVSMPNTLFGQTMPIPNYIIDFDIDTPSFNYVNDTLTQVVGNVLLNDGSGTNAGFGYIINMTITGGPEGNSPVEFMNPTNTGPASGTDASKFDTTGTRVRYTTVSNGVMSGGFGGASAISYAILGREGTNDITYLRDPSSKLTFTMELDNNRELENIRYELGDMDFILGLADSIATCIGDTDIDYNCRFSYIDQIEIISGAGSNQYTFVDPSKITQVGPDKFHAAVPDTNNVPGIDYQADGRIPGIDANGNIVVYNSGNIGRQIRFEYDDPGFSVEGDTIDDYHDFDAFNQVMSLLTGITFDAVECSLENPILTIQSSNYPEHTLVANVTARANRTLTYQWQSSTTDCSTGFSDINGATDTTYTVNNITQPTFFRVVIREFSGTTEVCDTITPCISLGAFKGCIIEDTNRDGVLNDGNTPIPNIPISIYDCTDLSTPLATVNTDEQGNYSFHSLPNGNYTVRIDSPVEYKFPQGTSVLGDLNANNGFSDCMPIQDGSTIKETIGLGPCIPIELSIRQSTILEGEEVCVTVTNGPGDYYWTPSTGVSLGTEPDTYKFQPNESTIYTVRSNGYYSCEDENWVNVYVWQPYTALNNPCSCIGNSNFEDEILIFANTPTENWILTSANGINRSLGTSASYIGPHYSGLHTYSLTVQHTDGVGYTATFSNGTETLQINNICFDARSCNGPEVDREATPNPNDPECVINMNVSETSAAFDTLTNCNPGCLFRSDLSVDNRLYADTSARNNVQTICPSNRWQRVNVVFSEFGLATRDTLFVFEGRDTMSIPIDTFSGNGVSATGGWIAASCDPSVNQSGCLTFQFKTNGDSNKSIGWQAWAQCEDREVEIKATMNDIKLDCKDVDSLVRFPMPQITLNCGDHGSDVLVDSSYIFYLRNAKGELCFRDSVGDAENRAPLPRRLAPGLYSIEYFLASDSVKTSGRQVFSVSVPNMVCNDEVSTSLNSGCGLELALDDLLENPCDSVGPGVSFAVSLIDGTKGGFGPFVLSGVPNTENGCTALADLKMHISRDSLEQAGFDLCSGSFTLRIERRYTPRDTVPNGLLGTGDTVCHNGIQIASCDVSVNYVDQIAPLVNGISENTITIATCDTEGLGDYLQLEVFGGCDEEASVEILSINLTEALPCYGGNDTAIATVTVQSSDACGNNRTFDQVIRVVRPYIFVYPADEEVDCKEEIQINKLPGVIVGVVTDDSDLKYGVDTIDLSTADTIYLDTTAYRCGYLLAHSQTDVPENVCGDKVFIEWNLLDWCSPNSGPIQLTSPMRTSEAHLYGTPSPSLLATRTALVTASASARQHQFFERVDQTPPVLEATDNTYSSISDSLTKEYLILNLPSDACTFDATTVAPPKAQDNCDDNPTVILHKVEQIEKIVEGTRSGMRDSIEENSLWEVDREKLTCDTFRLMYIASDECHEQTEKDTLYRFVIVIDNTPPTAVCTDQVNVSLGTVGTSITATEIDAGSTDACGINSILIRRKEDAHVFAEVVLVECEDIHHDFQIELQVTDNKGNTNNCWTDVIVEDKISPICGPLEDVSINCNETHTDNLGEDTDSDKDGVLEDSEWRDLSVEQAEVWNEYFGNPATVCSDNATCQALVFEQQYQLIGQACGQAFGKRRYRAIDWEGAGNRSNWVEQNIAIVYVPEWVITLPKDTTIECTINGVNDLPAFGEADIIIESGICDQVAVEVASRSFISREGACEKMEVTYHIFNWCLAQSNDDTPQIITRPENANGQVTEAHDFTDAQTSTAHYTYTRIISLVDNTAPAIVEIITPDNCIETGTLENGCSEYKQWSAWANDCTDRSQIDWIAKIFETDAAGNILREVLDTEQRREGAHWTISAKVENKKYYQAEFWAADGCGNSSGQTSESIQFWDCKQPTPYALHGVAIELMATGSVAIWASDLNQGSFDNCTLSEDLIFTIKKVNSDASPTPSIIFDCKEIGTQPVELHVTDGEGNTDFVTTYVIVQDNFERCTDTDKVQVVGTILDRTGNSIEQVQVSVNDRPLMHTQEDGAFSFELAKAADCVITPEKDMEPLNGVSTFDLVLISRHILGIVPFDSPYQYIAADVNRSGSITAFDIVQIRQLILNLTSEFPNNTSWRFVEAGYEFSETPLQDNFKESIVLNNLATDQLAMDFIGIKIGDVNGNARANNYTSSETRSSPGTFTISTTDRYVKAGDEIRLSFNSSDLPYVEGYQFALKYDGLTINALEEGIAKMDNFNIHQKGWIVTSWHGKANAEKDLFAVHFKVTTDGWLSDLLAIATNPLQPEAYTTTGALLDVTLNFEIAENVFELKQNQPNPFKEETTIGFHLPEAGPATLRIIDLQGKVLKIITQDYTSGYHEISLKSADLPAKGVFYYQLEAADKVANKRMILLGN